MSEYDAIVIGAGFGGLRALHEMRELGLSVKVLEAGTDVGGTWYWNRYPGARTDSESWVYAFSFDDELQQDWDWPERFPSQPQVEQYFQHVVERFDMRKDIQFNARVASAVYDEDANVWTVTTEAGESFTCTYFIAATGLLSVALKPPFPGVDSFEGEWYQTSRWPKEPVDFADKRVAVVGTGATAVQVIPEVAHQCEHLTVYQRTPNYVMPGRNHALGDAQRREIKRKIDEIWEKADHQVFAFPFDPANRMSTDMSDEEIHRVLEAGWEAGGFRFLFETFDDMLIDQRCNDLAAEFVRNKIRAVVKDPETAELLCPKNHPVGGKRPPLGHFYFEAYNRDNVELISVVDNPIEALTPTGNRQADGTEHEFDIIIFAVGFDAVTGALTTMDVRGRGGRTLNDQWTHGAKTYLGMCDDGFPNMFMILGPQGPFANLPPVIDHQVEFIGRAITHLREQGADAIEATPEAVTAWNDQCDMLLNATLLPQGEQANAWFLGANVPGKPQKVLFYFGGAGAYFDELKRTAASGFEGFEFKRTESAAGVGG